MRSLWVGYSGIDSGSDDRFCRIRCGNGNELIQWSIGGWLHHVDHDHSGQLDRRWHYLRRRHGRYRARRNFHDAPTFALLVGLGIYNMFAGGFGETLSWLFTPDFSKIDGPVLLAAVGQAFFSIGVGMGGMMAYGSYLPANFPLPGRDDDRAC